MLVDVQFRRPDPQMSFVLRIVAGGDRGPLIPERLQEGAYICGHWSVDQLGVPCRERWSEVPYDPLDFPDYGVCDSPQQAIDKLRLRERPEKFFVVFVRIRRSSQPADGGWRWHKWGEYIGDKTPTQEYLYDEPLIEEVYTYHVCEPK